MAAMNLIGAILIGLVTVLLIYAILSSILSAVRKL